jgi:hypothetical protein
MIIIRNCIYKDCLQISTLFPIQITSGITGGCLGVPGTAAHISAGPRTQMTILNIFASTLGKQGWP